MVNQNTGEIGFAQKNLKDRESPTGGTLYRQGTLSQVQDYVRKSSTNYRRPKCL